MLRLARENLYFIERWGAEGLEEAPPNGAGGSGGGSGGTSADAAGDLDAQQGAVLHAAAVQEACDAADQLIKCAGGLRGGARASALCGALEQMARASAAMRRPGACGATAANELLDALRTILRM